VVSGKLMESKGELSDELTELGEDPKERCTLSLERWRTLLEGTNPKEVHTDV
jgi:hypothetical protein